MKNIKRTFKWKQMMKISLAMLGSGLFIVSNCLILTSCSKNNEKDKPTTPPTTNPDPNPIPPNPSNPNNNQLKQFKTLDFSKDWGIENEMNYSFRLLMIDVGQADSLLLQFAKTNDFTIKENTYNVLIDAGDWKQQISGDEGNEAINTPNYNQKLKNTLNSYLVSNGSKDLIDMFIFSHADADHIGGGDDVINDWCKPNESIVLSFGNNEKTTATWKNVLEATVINDLIYVDPFLDEALNTPTMNELFKTSKTYFNQDWNYNKLKDIEPNTKLIKFSDNKWFSYVCPSYDYKTTGNGLNETNESSINNFLKWNDYQFLFAGDSEGKTHDDLIKIMRKFPEYKNEKGNYTVDFYKSAHHGSITHNSNNVNYLKQIIDQDTHILISQNDNRLYGGTPTFTESSIRNLVNAGVSENKVLTTQELGDILITIEGNQSYFIFNETRQESYKNGDWTYLGSMPITFNPSKNYLNPKYTKYFYKLVFQSH